MLEKKLIGKPYAGKLHVRFEEDCLVTNCYQLLLDFELIKGEKLTSHIDLVKAAFIASFPMEAAMPYILEEAMYGIYEDKGWNINSGKNDSLKDPWNCQGELWPNISELLLKLEQVIKSKHFGLELEANYKGSLIARISNFTIGSKGRMLNCRLSTDFKKLINKKVILELEDLKDSREKSLMMALILSRISIIVKEKYKENHSFRHITLIEEAHRLLSKIEYGDEGSKKIGIEIFTDILAEVRKYGESLIIVDQIPSKLTSEVLKNTSTKIVHKLFSQDDKDAIGNTMLLSEEQKEYLSIMKTGEAVMFSQDWNKAVNMMIDNEKQNILGSFDENLLFENRITKMIKDMEILFPYIYKYKEKLNGIEVENLIERLEQIIYLVKKINKDKTQEKNIRNEIINYLNVFKNKEVVKNILLETVDSIYLNFEIQDNKLEKSFLDIFDINIQLENIKNIEKILKRL